MILSKQKCCLWSTGVSVESQNPTYVLHLRQNVLATRNMTRIDVELPTFYWLPKLHKRPYKSRFISQVTALLPFFRSILHLL